MTGRLMRRRILCALAFVCALAATTSAADAQASNDIRVVRRADRRALILLLPLQLRDFQHPVDLSRFILLDRSDKSVLPLKSASDISEQGCARHGYPRTRVCLELADGAPALIDSHAYLLALDSIAVKSDAGPAFIGANVSLQVTPVGARVTAIGKAPVKSIEVAYDIDALGDSTLGIKLTVGGKALVIPDSANRRAGEPLCYNLNTLSFRCTFDPPVHLHQGDKITATFVRIGPSDAPVPPVSIKPATYTTTSTVDLSKQSLCSLCIQGGLSQTTKTKTATLQVQWRNTPFALRYVHEGSDGYLREGSLSPYLDLLVSTDPTTKGYIDPGLQYSGFIHWNEDTHFLSVIAAYLTPRAELDKKATVMNFIPLDLVFKPGLGGLTSHGIFLGGLIQVWPDVGLEQGWTVKGRRVARAESNDPSRWKGGLSVIAKWFGPAKPTGFCKTIGCAEFDITADWQHYKLNDVPASEPTSNQDYGTLSAIYKFTEHVGLSFSFCNGNPPPLFIYQRVESLGLSIVY